MSLVMTDPGYNYSDARLEDPRNGGYWKWRILEMKDPCDEDPFITGDHEHKKKCCGVRRRR